MKYIIVLMDGVADYRLAELGDKTPLEFARTPVIDSMVRKSRVGLVKTVPGGMAPGSDVANLSVMGYDPKKYYTGRSSLEAASMGLKLSDEDISFRCNLVTLSGEESYKQKTMIDYSAGEISTDESAILIDFISKRLQTEKIKFYPGVSYRHIIVWEKGVDKNILTPPHDISGKKIADYLPGGPAGDVLFDMMEKSSYILKEHEINKRRIEKGLNPANSIWIWGEGRRPSLDSFYKKYGLKGSIISAVDLIKGIGILAGLKSVAVEGATGTIDTNFKGKANAAIRELSGNKDFVYIHLEATDECGHQGDVKNKVRAIEIIDNQVIGPVKQAMDKKQYDYRIMILPDHYTPISLRTHSSEPVPFLIYDSRERIDNNIDGFNEFSGIEKGLYFKEGWELADYFFEKK